jgi:hypothetical protein
LFFVQLEVVTARDSWLLAWFSCVFFWATADFMRVHFLANILFARPKTGTLMLGSSMCPSAMGPPYDALRAGYVVMKF